MNAQQFILPGDYFFGEFDGLIVTLLGSCVAVSLWHPQRRLAALTHYLLPSAPDADPEDTRYGEGVFHRLQLDMRRHRSHPSEYRMGLFGGGGRIGNLHDRVGPGNVRFARECFQRLAWRAEQEALGGTDYRRLSLDGRTGKLLCQCLSSPIQVGSP